jgi:hypothetical protein
LHKKECMREIRTGISNMVEWFNEAKGENGVVTD